MKVFAVWVFSLAMVSVSLGANAHIDWESVNGVDCSSGGCLSLQLQAGASIPVRYNVSIVHGDPVSIIFKNGSQEIPLKENLPETPGVTGTTLSLPNIECGNCELIISANIYKGAAKIQLIKEEVPDEPYVYENVAPIATLSVWQNGTEVTWVSTREGLVTLRAGAIDPNTEETHSFDWTGTDNRLVKSNEGNDSFIFDPSELEEETYTVLVEATDDGLPVLSGSFQLDVQVLSAAAPVSVPSMPSEATTATKGRKKSGSMDWPEILFGLVCALYCGTIVRQGIKKAHLKT